MLWIIFLNVIVLLFAILFQNLFFEWLFSIALILSFEPYYLREGVRGGLWLINSCCFVIFSISLYLTWATLLKTLKRIPSRCNNEYHYISRFQICSISYLNRGEHLLSRFHISLRLICFNRGKCFVFSLLLLLNLDFDSLFWNLE